MSDEQTVDAVLRSIPGWEGAKWERLSGGFTNTTYKVTAGSHTGVLKVDDKKRSAPFNMRRAEEAVQRTAAAKGLAPNVIWANDVAYFTEFVEGQVWSRDSFTIDGQLEILASALKSLHALPLSRRSFDAVAAAKRYLDDIDSLSGDITERCMTIVEESRLPANVCCCHNDLVAENLISTPELKFLDWEYACDNDPLFDLATVIEHHELGEEQASRLLTAYFGDDAEHWQTEIQTSRRLYLALLCLWMAARPDSDTAEIHRIAGRLTTSCS